MKIETSRFGTLDIDDSMVFNFPMGLLGFAKLKKYIVIDHTEDSPFKWLQSCEEPSLAFIITDPVFFRSDYRVTVRRSELTMLNVADDEELVVSVIMTIPDNPQDMSANLLAPLIFNMANRHGMQYVLTNSNYPVKYYALRERGKQPAVPPGSQGPSKTLTIT